MSPLNETPVTPVIDSYKQIQHTSSSSVIFFYKKVSDKVQSTFMFLSVTCLHCDELFQNLKVLAVYQSAHLAEENSFMVAITKHIVIINTFSSYKHERFSRKKSNRKDIYLLKIATFLK